MDPIEKYRQDKKDMNAQLKTLGKAMFKPFFEALFKKHKDIQVVKWTQYTPHFNDGDACTFSVNDPEVSVKSVTPEDMYVEEDWYSSWSIPGSPGAKAAKEVGNFFVDIEDVLETAFGDGVQVFVQRDGSITVEDYDHD